MFRSLWIHKLLGLSRSRSTRRRQAAQNRRFIRPSVEGLEDRITPSGGPVNVTAATTTDLIKDINDFNSGKYNSTGLQITLSGSNYQLPSQEQITNASGLTLKGSGAGKTSITAGPQSRAFDITTGVTVTFEDLTIQGGNVAQTIGAHSGGGAIRDIGGNVTLSGVTIQKNTVTSGLVPPAEGGGVYVSHTGSLTIKANSIIQNNNAIGSTPLLHFADAHGGGVFVTTGSTLSIDSSTITGNLARGGSGQDAAGGGVYANGSQVSITKTTISDNIAQGGNGIHKGNGGDASGGGLYLKDDSGIASMDLTGDTITGNLAQAGNGGLAGRQEKTIDPAGNGGNANGGGVYLTNGESNVDFTGTSFTKNTALAGNGGNATQPGVSGGNGGYASGGGLYLSLRDGTHSVTLAQAVFTSNDAQGGSGGNGADATNSGTNGGNGGGAGSGTGGGAYLFGHGTVNMIGASVSNNTATGGNGGNGGVGAMGTTGGKGGNGGNGASGLAGGVYTEDIHLNITNSAFVSNTATGGNGGNGGNGGTGGFQGGDAGGGGDGRSGAGGAIYYNSGYLTVLNTTIANNTAQGGNGGAGGIGGAGGTNGNGDDGKDGDGNVGLGGGIYDNGNGDNGTLFNDTIANNNALGGTGGNVKTVQLPNGQEFTGLGGGYFNANQIFFQDGPTVQNTLFQGNIAASGPDFSGDIGQFHVTNSESNNFFSSIDGTRFPNRSPLGNGTPNTSDIVSTVAQLGKLTTDPATGLAYFPLLASSDAIDKGTITTLSAIAAAQGVTPADATDEIGNPRVFNNVMDIGAIEFGGESTTVTVSPVTITQSSSPTQINLTANVAGSLINEGAVSFSVKDGGGNPVGGTVANVQVINGVATTTFMVPGNTGSGSYTITASYTDPGGRFGSNSGTGTLTINATGTGTTLTPGNASVKESSSSQTTNVGVLVISPSGTVTEGTVTVQLMLNGSSVSTASASVTNGAANVTGLTVPASVGGVEGTYQLVESYHDSTGKFGDSEAFGTLTVTGSSSTPITTTGPVTVSGPITAGGVSAGAVTSSGPTTIVNSSGPDVFTALFTIAVDAAEFVLMSAGITSIGGVPLPPSSQLLAEIQANIPFADGLAMAALTAGVQAGTQAAAQG